MSQDLSLKTSSLYQICIKHGSQEHCQRDKPVDRVGYKMTLLIGYRHDCEKPPTDLKVPYLRDTNWSADACRAHE